MVASRVRYSVLCIFMGMYGFWSNTLADSRRVTLSAEVIIDNQSGRDIVGYVHRISIPVEHSLQQTLKNVRYNQPEKVVYKSHSKGDSKYLEFEFNIPSGEVVRRVFHFDLILTSYDYTEGSNGKEPFPPGRYLQPEQYIESDSLEIKRIAMGIQNTFGNIDERLRAAFLLPQIVLNYKVQPTKGALAGLSSRSGDCTEYASLFVAVARSMGYPARVTSEFHFTKKTEFPRPNHHAAEVFMNGRWVPVDPNLAKRPTYGYGFGRGRLSKITLTRDFTWTWSNLWPADFREYADKASVTMAWSLR